VLSGKNLTEVAGGWHHTVALCSDGTIAAWGGNNNGQLGNGSNNGSSVPVLVDRRGVLNGKTIISITAGRFHSLALCSDGTIAAWGGNSDGQLGNRSRTDSNVPVLVEGTGVLSGKTPTAIAAGALHNLALCSDGTFVAWGNNTEGELNNGSYSDSTIPVLVDRTGVLAGKTISAIAAGALHSLALCSDGSVVTWGANTFGQLGNGWPYDDVIGAVLVDTSGVLNHKTVTSVAAGGNHNVVLCSDGTLAAWGLNSYGQIGNESNSNSSLPMAVTRTGVLNGKTVTSIAAGEFHSLALCSDGTLGAWGMGSYGQLGNGSTSDSNLPVEVVSTGVLTSKTASAIAATGFGSMALADDSAPPIVSVSDIARAIYEGSATRPGSATFKIGLSAAYSQTVTANFRTVDGTARAGADYMSKSGTLAFSPGETTKYVRVNLIGDDVAEFNETFFLNLGAPVNATIAKSRGVAYIRNDDGPRIFIDNAGTVNEGHSGMTLQHFTVRLSEASTRTVTVDYATAHGTAGPTDYVAAAGRLFFAPGVTSQIITVQVRCDMLLEPNETYRMNLSKTAHAVIADSQGVAYIRNDDSTLGLTGASRRPSR
jgi:alpha-tubulin suppressor-like RCC1 family protein